MLVIVSKKDGSSMEYDDVRKTYVQNGKLLVLEYYPPALIGEYPIIDKKIPLDDIEDIEEVHESWVKTRKSLDKQDYDGSDSAN